MICDYDKQCCLENKCESLTEMDLECLCDIAEFTVTADCLRAADTSSAVNQRAKAPGHCESNTCTYVNR